MVQKTKENKIKLKSIVLPALVAHMNHVLFHKYLFNTNSMAIAWMGGRVGGGHSERGKAEESEKYC